MSQLVQNKFIPQNCLTFLKELSLVFCLIKIVQDWYIILFLFFYRSGFKYSDTCSLSTIGWLDSVIILCMTIVNVSFAKSYSLSAHFWQNDWQICIWIFSDNPYMWCNSILELMVRFQNTSRLEFQNRNDTNCLSVRSFHWFNSTDAMTLSQLELLTKGVSIGISIF